MQLKLSDFASDKIISYHYVPFMKQYKSNRGLSERQFKKQLEKADWEVWRGGLINITRRQDLYPNIRWKYKRLITLLEKHHPDKVELLEYLCHQAGMPDFICYRNQKFKFVECKFKHESLSRTQKRCILRLQSHGFEVEVLKFVESRTRVRMAEINYCTGQKRIIAKQLALN